MNEESKQQASTSIRPENNFLRNSSPPPPYSDSQNVITTAEITRKSLTKNKKDNKNVEERELLNSEPLKSNNNKNSGINPIERIRHPIPPPITPQISNFWESSTKNNYNEIV